jgi:hypothetical protein
MLASVALMGGCLVVLLPRFTSIAPFTLLLVVGCASTVPVITSNGPIPREGSIQYAQFKASFDHANQLALQMSNANKSIEAMDVQLAYRQMVIDGFGLVYANCSDFFRSEGENQKWIIFGRDMVAAVGTLATAVSAAASAPTGVTTGFSIATATAYNGLDIYQRNFLFGSDNIESVRDLITKALSVHETVVLADSRPWNGFGEATQSIMDHQSTCLPAAILQLTRSAIKNGTVVQSTPSEGSKQVNLTISPPAPLPPPQPMTLLPQPPPPIVRTPVPLTPEDKNDPYATLNNDDFAKIRGRFDLSDTQATFPNSQKFQEKVKAFQHCLGAPQTGLLTVSQAATAIAGTAACLPAPPAAAAPVTVPVPPAADVQPRPPQVR